MAQWFTQEQDVLHNPLTKLQHVGRLDCAQSVSEPTRERAVQIQQTLHVVIEELESYLLDLDHWIQEVDAQQVDLNTQPPSA